MLLLLLCRSYQMHACVSLHWGRHQVSLSIMLHLMFLRQGLSLDADKSSARSKCFLSPCLSLLFPAWLHNVEFPIQRQLVWWELTYMVCSRSCGNGRQSVITTMCDSTLVGALSGLKSFFLIQIHGGFFFSSENGCWVLSGASPASLISHPPSVSRINPMNGWSWDSAWTPLFFLDSCGLSKLSLPYCLRTLSRQ